MMELNNIYLGDAYKLIKELPDKSVDIIYTDIPYSFEKGGTGDSFIAKDIEKLCNKDLIDIRDGIDYSIFDEFVRVLKHIYIYMVQ